VKPVKKTAAKKLLKRASPRRKQKVKARKTQARKNIRSAISAKVPESPDMEVLDLDIEIPEEKEAGGTRERGADAEDSSPEDKSSLPQTDSVKAYMQDIGQLSLVTRVEEVELAAKIHGNDPKLREEARTALIKANLRLVVKIAHDYRGYGLPLSDLISEGNIGLMRAVEKFDPGKGAKFSSYSAWWIKQSMRRALSNQSRTIRVPIQSAGKMHKIKSARIKLAEKLGRESTDAEIAGFLEFSERTVTSLKLADTTTFSIHAPIQQGESGEFQDVIADNNSSIPDRILGDVESVSRLANLMEGLDRREKLILKMRFGLDGSSPGTLDQVSHEIGRTRERVRQIQNQALTKLRSMLIDESSFVTDMM